VHPASFDRLSRQWTAVLDAFRVPAEAAGGVLADLVARYGEPHRHYHTLDHIAAVLDVLAAFGTLDPALSLAAWYHDTIYDTHATDNEERSAGLARATLVPLGVPVAVVEETARLIVLTKSHQTTEADLSGCQLLDADLSILGSDPESYERYAAAIRREYAWVPEEAYRAGRRRVLEGFLMRPGLFVLLTELESPARRNMEQEIRALGQQ